MSASLRLVNPSSPSEWSEADIKRYAEIAVCDVDADSTTGLSGEVTFCRGECNGLAPNARQFDASEVLCQG